MKFPPQKDLMLFRFLSLCSFCLFTQSLFSATITYQEDATNFPNPERGYYTSGISESDLQDERKNGITVARKYYRLDAYVNSDDIEQSYLDNITKDASILRKTGAKMVPRFIYNCGGCSNPTLPRILLHIEKLTPVLRANSDVIAFLETGFIGMCGEWHYSSCTPVYNHNNSTAHLAVLSKLLGAVPNRMVALRYNFHKRGMFGDVPLGPDSAFSGSHAARTGAHNDCFGYDEGDRGTYQGPKTTEWQKSYLNQDNRYVPQGGETCGNPSHCNCSFALTDFKRMHWDVINSDYDKNVINSWQSGGCNETIKKLLGYRLKLISAQLPDAVRPGYIFSGTINLVNIGWGKIYNFRGCELVFRNTLTKSKFIVKLSNDPRRWCMTDSAVAVNVSAIIPEATLEGTYQVYLNLPDTAASIHNRPEYSIRLANTNVWEDSTGYNSLQHIVVIQRIPPPLGTVLTKAAALKNLESVRVRKNNGSIEFTLLRNPLTPVTFEIFTPSGAKVWNHTVMPREGGAGTVKWTGGSSGVYIWKVSLNDDGGSSHAATGVIRSLMICDY